MIVYKRVDMLIIAALVILILIIVIYFCYQNAKAFNSYIPGLYEGDAEFLKQADLSHFFLLITQRENGEYVASILINSLEDAIIENTIVDIKISNKYLSLSHDFTVYDCKIDSPVAVLPETFKMSISYLSGALTLYDKDNVYALLVKNLID